MSKFFSEKYYQPTVVLKVYHIMVSKTTHNIQKSVTYFPTF